MLRFLNLRRWEESLFLSTKGEHAVYHVSLGTLIPLYHCFEDVVYQMQAGGTTLQGHMVTALNCCFHHARQSTGFRTWQISVQVTLQRHGTQHLFRFEEEGNFHRPRLLGPSVYYFMGMGGERTAVDDVSLSGM